VDGDRCDFRVHVELDAQVAFAQPVDLVEDPQFSHPFERILQLEEFFASALSAALLLVLLEQEEVVACGDAA